MLIPHHSCKLFAFFRKKPLDTFPCLGPKEKNGQLPVDASCPLLIIQLSSFCLEKSPGGQLQIPSGNFLWTFHEFVHREMTEVARWSLSRLNYTSDHLRTEKPHPQIENTKIHILRESFSLLGDMRADISSLTPVT